ncbi:hypothetical protein Misp05_59010 [Micromonospora sp. NBRC 107095]|nr:hypothetical protein Misp05_59010 [Micromonospora sp. NBRC 107095]
MSVTENEPPRHSALRALWVSLSDNREKNAAPEILTYYFPTKQTLASAVINLAYPGADAIGAC